VILRTMTGFGVGGTLPVDYSIFAEYLPQKKRGRYLVLLESFWALGVIAAAGLAWLIVPKLWLALAAGCFGHPGLLIILHPPRHPRIAALPAGQRQPEEAREVLARWRGERLHMPPIPASASEKTGPPADLTWKPELRRTTLLLWLMWFGISLGYYGVFTWLPTFFRSSGMEMLPVYQNTFILALAQLPGYFSAAYLVEKWGRRRTLAFYLVASGIFHLPVRRLATSLNMLVAMGIWMSFFTLGAWGALYAYTPEAYPTNLRGTGMGAASG
jgi:MFS transporter, putative metabolite:H+ symporter